jgi:hypothetical protein
MGDIFSPFASDANGRAGNESVTFAGRCQNMEQPATNRSTQRDFVDNEG